MKECQQVQESIVLAIAQLGREPQWDGTTAEHLASCAGCRELLEQELELCQYLDDPLPLPPRDLITSVMSRIEADVARLPQGRPEPGLPWAERFAWAASGAAAMYGLERLPSMSVDWLSEVQVTLFSLMGSLAAPFEVNGLYLVVLALGLLVAQGAMVYQVRGSAS